MLFLTAAGINQFSPLLHEDVDHVGVYAILLHCTK